MRTDIKMKPRQKTRSIFTYLYAASFIGIVGAIILFIELTSGYLMQSDIDSFVESSGIHVQSYLDSKGKPGGFYERINQSRELIYYTHSLALIDDNAIAGNNCTDCRMLTSFQGQDVYIRDDKYFSSAFPIPETNQFLLLTEFEDPFELQQEWYEDPDTHFLIMMFVMIGLLLGLLIYVPLVVVNKRVKKLLDVQKQFGQGNLSVRAETSRVSPMKEIADSFNYMADDIESKVKQSQIFSYAIPHEIRTPLTRIQVASDLLRREDTQQKEQLFDQIDCYIEDISLLTSDILKLAKLTNQSGEKSIEPSEISLTDLCQTRLDLMSDAETKTLIVKDEIRPICSAPECYIKLVIDNLIKNATKYGNGEVRVTLSDSEQHWCIDIEDNGKGIPKDKQEEIFIAFSRLDKSRNLNKGGFGLGLAIASQAAKNAQLTIHVDDSDLDGAKFTLKIPKPKS